MSRKSRADLNVVAVSFEGARPAPPPELDESENNVVGTSSFIRIMAGTFGLAGSNNDSASAERLLETYPTLDVQ